MDPVVEGRAARHVLAEGGDIARDGSVHYAAGEGGVIGPLDQEARLVRGVVRPVQGDFGRLLVIYDGASRQVGGGCYHDDDWWCTAPRVERQGGPSAAGQDLVEGRIRVVPGVSDYVDGVHLVVERAPGP